MNEPMHKVHPKTAPVVPAYAVNHGKGISDLIGVTQDKYFPFSSMTVGDSFILEADNPHALTGEQIYYAANAYARQKIGFRISTRRRKDGSRIVMRVK